MIIKNTDEITKTKLNLGNFNINLPNTFLPKPTENDYRVGYIERYVVSKINYSEITEVSRDVYGKIDSNFFRKEKFKWKITGVLNNKYDGKMLLQQGVIEFNKKQGFAQFIHHAYLTANVVHKHTHCLICAKLLF